jgi:alpha-L-fucosidase
LQSSAEGLTLSLPAAAPDPVSSTIVLQVKGPLDIERAGLTQESDGSIVLPAREARLHGSELQYETGEQRDNIGFWTNPDDWADWEFKVTRPGNFDVTAEVAALERASFEVSVGDSAARGEAAATGDYGRFRAVKLGTLHIASPGKVTLVVRSVKNGWHPLNLKAIRLNPAAASP